MTDAAAPAPKRDLRIVFTGLMLVLTLAALDQSIVATALPRIVSDLGGVSQFSWVVTAYVLASTVTVPLYGKLSDQYGRRPLLYLAIGVFLAGSALAGLARDMTALILFRAIQGLGAGGLLPLTQIIIGDLVSPRERGRYQGLFGAVFAVCSVAGPVLGGIITDVLSWHWIFYINLPVGAVAIGFLAASLERPAPTARRRIDYPGAALITTAATLLLLILSLGGVAAPWDSPAILGAAAATIALLALFLAWERRVPEPILPLGLFRVPTMAVATPVLALTFMGMMGATVFFPLYFQLVLGVPAADSGLLTGPLMIGVVTSSMLGGRLVSMTGRYKRLPAAGLATATLAFLTLGWAAIGNLGIAVIEPALVIQGLGMGLVMPTLTVAVQNAVGRADMGTATGAIAFFRSLGGVVGVACSGGILTLALTTGLAGSPLAGRIGQAELLHQGVDQIAHLPPDLAHAVTALYRHAIATTFFAGAAITALAFLVVLLLPELPLRAAVSTAPAPAVTE